MATQGRRHRRCRQRQDGQDRDGRDRTAGAATRSTARQQRRTSTFLAHDEKNEAKVGDKVAITETASAQPPQALGGDLGRREGEGHLRRTHP